MNITRRKFFSTSLGMAALGRMAQFSASAQTTGDYKALVCVFLIGGNDGNNTIVPLEASQYQSYAGARKSLALAQNTLLPFQTPGGAMYGFHPSLQPIANLFSLRKMAVVANVGTLIRPITRSEYQQHTAPVPHALFSHSDQQMLWDSSGNPATGWAGRIADRMTAGPTEFPQVISVAGPTLFGRGVATQAATFTPNADPGLLGFDMSPAGLLRYQAFQELLSLDSGAGLVQTSATTAKEGIRIGGLLKSALANSSALSTPFPASQIGQQLQQIARIIKVRGELGATRQIFFCSLTGFDTHVGQSAIHASLLARLAEALAAFYTATQELGVASNVTTFTESEFGRTLQPGAGLGTDHAWGNHQLVIGDAVRGGDMYGRYPEIGLGSPDDIASRGVWIPAVASDQYFATLARWFGANPGDMPSIFPLLSNFSSSDLGFMA